MNKQSSHIWKKTECHCGNKYLCYLVGNEDGALKMIPESATVYGIFRFREKYSLVKNASLEYVSTVLGACGATVPIYEYKNTIGDIASNVLIR